MTEGKLDVRRDPGRVGTECNHSVYWHHIADCLDKVLRNGLVGKPEVGSSNWNTKLSKQPLVFFEHRALQTMSGLTVALPPPERDPHLGWRKDSTAEP